MTMNDSWGYHTTDDDWKNAQDHCAQPGDCAHGTGNYLLNIGPSRTAASPRNRCAF